MDWMSPSLFAIRADNSLHERRRGKMGKVASTVTPYTSPRFSSPTASVSHSLPEPEHMQPGHTTLTPEQRQQRVDTWALST